MYRQTKLVEKCQLVIQQDAFADTHGAADLLGDHDTAEVVDAAYNTGCFHI